ncbi:MAG TPA: zinc-ribbon domain-containing protein [Methanothermobacter sp.]|nr:zinc-ribbon domain-containing protein [Methanothermobacter sp.]
MYCPNCGSENKDDAQFCESCGTKLDAVGGDIGSSANISQSQPYYQKQDSEANKPSSILVVLGYIFAILGGLIGVVLGFILYSKDNHEAKTHGRNILIISAVVIVLGVLVSGYVVSMVTSDVYDTISSSSDSYSGDYSSTSSTSSTGGSVSLVISYSGEWSGAVSDSSGTRTIEGYGDKTINLGNIDGAVAANAQKSDGGSGVISISLKQNGKTLKTDSTTSKYGLAQVSTYLD